MQCPNCGKYMQFKKNSGTETHWYCPKCKDYPLEKKQEIEILTLDQLPEKQQELQVKLQLENLKTQQQQLALQQQQLQMQQIQYNSMLKCPKCGSTSVIGQKKGYGVVKGGLGAAALGAATGGIGVIVGLGAGNIGRKKIRCTCMNCGYSFKAGKK
ncbi:MAG: zinc ribbon domain-containing protein [Lachnospiraceae bacterium]|nr:zinc ribbon domain-containing protein [Lachnospiraceae bacterium]